MGNWLNKLTKIVYGGTINQNFIDSVTDSVTRYVIYLEMCGKHILGCLYLGIDIFKNY